MEIKQESIFISSLRSFFKGFAGFLGLAIGFVIIGIGISSIFKPQSSSEKTQMIIAPDANGVRDLLPITDPVILKINIHNVIGSKELNTSTVQAQLLDSRDDLLKKDRVKAILLHINSPGGTALDSHNIYISLMEYKRKYKVPIYAYVDGMCASGGMMIACSADKIFSSPIGIIGSVGVLMGPNFNISGLMEQYGVKQLTVKKGIDKDMLSPYRDWDPGEDKSIRAIVDYDYTLFVNLVAQSRPRMNKDKLINEYGAQIYNPITAQEYGYIDNGNSSYNDTLNALTKVANIEGAYQVIELKVRSHVLSSLIEGKSSVGYHLIKSLFNIPDYMDPSLKNQSLYLYPTSLLEATPSE